MSIMTGLITKSRQYSDLGNILNIIEDTTSKETKLSTVWTKSSKDYYSYGRALLGEGARFPQEDRLEVINEKYFIYSLFVYDSVTNELISPNDLQFEILYTNTILPYTVSKTDSFNIIYDAMGIDSRINLTLRIRGENYLTAYAQIGSETTTNQYEQSIGMVDVNNVPDGVAVVIQTLEQDADGTVEEYVLTFPESETRQESSTITIAEGTKFYDADGNLLTGDLTIKVGHFSPTNGTSLSLFSAGWDVPNLAIDGELTGPGFNFISLGFYSIEVVDEDGTVAKTINL